MAILRLLTLLALSLLISVPAYAELELAEQKIKAGLIYNFLKYTVWPSQTAMLSVCIFGDDDFKTALEPMKSRSVNQKQINVRSIQQAQEAGSCQLLFIGREETPHWPSLRDELSGKSVLTVSDQDGFLEDGGMIELGHHNNRIDVRVDTKTLNAANLEVQDRLLKLVTVMKSDTPEAP